MSRDDALVEAVDPRADRVGAVEGVALPCRRSQLRHVYTGRGCVFASAVRRKLLPRRFRRRSGVRAIDPLWRRRVGLLEGIRCRSAIRRQPNTTIRIPTVVPEFGISVLRPHRESVNRRFRYRGRPGDIRCRGWIHCRQPRNPRDERTWLLSGCAPFPHSASPSWPEGSRRASTGADTGSLCQSVVQLLCNAVAFVVWASALRWISGTWSEPHSDTVGGFDCARVDQQCPRLQFARTARSGALGMVLQHRMSLSIGHAGQETVVEWW